MSEHVWEQDVRRAAERAGREWREAVGWVNDRAVPAARAEAWRARREGARVLRTLADRLDASRGPRG